MLARKKGEITGRGGTVTLLSESQALGLDAPEKGVGAWRAAESGRETQPRPWAPQPRPERDLSVGWHAPAREASPCATIYTQNVRA